MTIPIAGFLTSRLKVLLRTKYEMVPFSHCQTFMAGCGDIGYSWIAMSSSKSLSTFEIGTIYGVAPHSLRFYEDQGLLSPLIVNGTRRYTEKDRIKLELIQKGKRLGFSFVELKILILQTIEQRAAHDMPLADMYPITRSVEAGEIAEEIWQIDREMEKLTRRLQDLQSRLDGMASETSS